MNRCTSAWTLSGSVKPTILLRSDFLPVAVDDVFEVETESTCCAACAAGVCAAGACAAGAPDGFGLVNLIGDAVLNSAGAVAAAAVRTSLFIVFAGAENSAARRFMLSFDKCCVYRVVRLLSSVECGFSLLENPHLQRVIK